MQKKSIRVVSKALLSEGARTRFPNVRVVSEDLLFEGVRTRFAWSWVSVGPAALSQPVVRDTPAKHRVLELISSAQVPKDVKKQCRCILQTLPASQVKELERRILRLK